MRSIIVGGGKVGYNLFNTLKGENYDVIIIERDKETCSKIAEDFDADVFCGDGTSVEILKDAGIEEAEIIAAVTGTDEENLVICQMAKKSFNIKKTIARVNNPKNIKMFKILGIDKIVCSTEVIANLIKYELNKSDYRIINTFMGGSMILSEISIEDGFFWCDKLIKNLVLPEESVIVSVLRDEQVIYPRGNTQIVSNDKILVVTNSFALPEIIKEIKYGGIHNAKK